MFIGFSRGQGLTSAHGGDKNIKPIDNVEKQA